MAKKKENANVFLRLFSWLSYYFSRCKRKKTTGNYHHKRRYTKKQRRFFKQKTFAFERSADTGVVLPLVYGVLEYYKHFGIKFVSPAVNVALHLLNDIYNPTILTKPSREKLLNNEESRKIINGCFYDLLCDYGHLDIAYNERDYECLRDTSCDIVPSSGKGKNFYLTCSRIGITVAMFLVYYKGDIKVPIDVLEKCSGIHADRFEDAYQAILQVFKDRLEQDNRWKLLFSQQDMHNQECVIAIALQAFTQ